MKAKALLNLLPIGAIAVVGWLYGSSLWQQSQVSHDAVWETLPTILNAPFRDRPQSDAYQVLNVADGDTIAVRSLNTGRKARVRFACIDAPEVTHNGQPGQPLGEESKANLKRLIDQAGGRVIVQAVDRNRYGRIVGEVFIKHPQPSQPEEELLLNAEQVRSGMAYVYRQYARSCSQVELLDNLERQAKAAKKGIWGGNDQKPWEFRRSPTLLLQSAHLRRAARWGN